MLQFGIPDRILHYQGGGFENKLLNELEKYLGVKHCRTTSYHPICNGMVERMNSTLLQILRTLEETCKSRWKDELNKLMYGYNCRKPSLTGYSPYYLLFGRKSRLPVGAILKGQHEIEEKDQDYNNYSKKRIERMNEAYKIAN